MNVVDLNAKPATTVKEVIRAIDSSVELIEGVLNNDFYSLKLQSSNGKRTTERFRCNLLSDLLGKYNAHLYSELEQQLRNAIKRIQ
jgi:hypothetical protein